MLLCIQISLNVSLNAHGRVNILMNCMLQSNLINQLTRFSKSFSIFATVRGSNLMADTLDESVYLLFLYQDLYTDKSNAPHFRITIKANRGLA